MFLIVDYSVPLNMRFEASLRQMLTQAAIEYIEACKRNKTRAWQVFLVGGQGYAVPSGHAGVIVSSGGNMQMSSIASPAMPQPK